MSTITQQWAMANVSGPTKRAMMAGVMSAASGVSGIISPQTFQCALKDEKDCTYSKSSCSRGCQFGLRLTISAL
jgi:hypothetical protein